MTLKEIKDRIKEMQTGISMINRKIGKLMSDRAKMESEIDRLRRMMNHD